MITKEQPLLSVIVLCYNIEQFIDKCVSSIVRQTYSNLEILLIDDGSTDNSGTLCDAWQKQDKRIRVIHQQNAGSSCARKRGVESATAGYITFVDADDWIDKNMYTNMMSALLSTNSDIAQCGYCKVYKDGRIEHGNHENKAGSIEIVGREEGVLLILDDKKWKSYLWNKIFKKHLFDHVVFPKDLNAGEDMVSHDLFHHASQSVYLADEYCFYYQREGSLIRTDSISSRIKLQLQYARNLYSRYLFVKRHLQYHSMFQAVKERTMVESVISLRNMVVYPQHASMDCFQLLTKWLKAIPLSKRDALSLGFKLDIILVKINPKLFKTVRELYSFIKKRT